MSNKVNNPIFNINHMFYMLRNEYYCFYLSFSITGDEILSKNFSNSKYSGSNSNTRTSKPLLFLVKKMNVFGIICHEQ